MKETEIRKYGELMREFHLQKLTVTEGGETICLERSGGGSDTPAVRVGTEWDGEERQETSGLVSVSSPMVGIFYSAPAENEDPFVSAGDQVKKGDTLCIIESMKLMNEIMADLDGTVEKICLTNGQVVEYGTEIMRIRRRNG